MATIYTRSEREVLGDMPGYSYAGNLVHTATGNFVWHQTDLPMSDVLLSWHLTYNSRGEGEGPLGPGWTHSHGARLEPRGDNEVRFHDTNGRVLTFRKRGREFDRPQDIDADLESVADGFVLRFFHGESWGFDRSGRLREKRAEGRTVTLTYDDDRLVRVEHSAGLRLTLEYSRGRLTEVTSDDERPVAYTYDDGTLRRAAGPVGTTTYDSDDHRITRIVDADGVVLVGNRYDRQGRVVRQETTGSGALNFTYAEDQGRTTVTHDPSDARSTYIHNADYRATKVTDALGNTSTMDYASDGRLTRATVPGGGVLERAYTDGNLVSTSFGGATTRYEYDEHRRLVRLTDPAGEVTTYTYEGDSDIPATTTGPDGATSRAEIENGLVVSRTDPDGATVRYDYDRRRNLVEVIAADGQRTGYGYDGAGRRTRIVMPTGDTLTIVLDAAGRAVSQTGTDGFTVTNEYSAAGRLRRYTDAEGAATSLAYDSTGRLTSRTDRDGLVTTYEYDPSGRPSALVRPDGVRIETRFDTVGRIERVDEPDVGVTTFEYDAFGNQTAIRAPDGTTTMSFDPRGNQTSLTLPGGITTTYSYDAVDRLVERVDPSGAHWGTAYDSKTRTITYTDPDGSRRKEILNASGRVTTSIDAIGRRTEYRYDRNGELATIVDPEGGRTHFARDALGRVVARTTPSGLTTRYEYRDGRLVAVTDPRGWITRFGYDRNGRRTRITTPSGAPTTYAYNKRGALTRVTDPRGGVTTYTYDKAGNLTKVVDAKGVATTYTYDKAGRRVSITDPLGRTTRRTFNEQGRLASIQNPAGDVVRFAYDDAGRLVRRWTGEGDEKEEVTYAYDRAGRRVRMTDATGTTRYTYDTTGRLITAIWPGDDTYAWDYDAAGQLHKLTYPDGVSVTYRHNLNGQLISITDSQAGEVAYAVDPDGRLITEQLPQGWARRYGYDGGLLATFTEIRTGVITQHVVLARDSDGRITREADGDTVQEFAYDPAGQLVTADRIGAGETTRTHYGYDIAGNRTMSVTGGVATRYLYDAADQLVAVESPGRRIGYSYDGAGRLTRADDGDVRNRVTYNGFNHPIRTVTSRAWAVERTDAQYNGDGYLVRWRGRTGDDSAPHTDICYQWNVGDRLPQILHQRVDTDVPQSGNTAPPGRDLATARFTYGYARTFATTAYDSVNFARDVHGSSVTTESTLPWVQSASYDTFGAATGERILPGPALHPRIPRFGYRGELAFGPMLQLRARDYDTTLGRFTTRDPVSMIGKGTLANHPYAYAHNDPLNRMDPEGTWPTFATAAELISGILRFARTGCDECQNPGNDIGSHRKCFQGIRCLGTRGTFDAAELNAEQHALTEMWHTARPSKEAVGQCLAIYELNGRRQGFWRGVLEELGARRAISEHVDWEVGTRTGDEPPRFRADIMADEENIFEVKLWKNGAAYWEVEQQLDRYLLFGAALNLLFFKGKELEDWADSVDVITGFFRWPWSEEIVYAWGLNNPAGHIYVAKDDDDDRLPDDVKSKAEAARAQRETTQSGQIPLIPGIRVPPIVRVPV
jgi:RHS repeat-associated protein